MNQSLRFPEPAVAALDVRQAGRTRYVVRDGIRVLAYQRTGDRVHFFLDRAVHEDIARRWLPEVEGYAAGMVDYLLRAKIQIAIADNKAEVTVTGRIPSTEPDAMLHVYSDDEAGSRVEIATRALQGDTPMTFDVPKGARKLAAYVRGRDGAGTFVAGAETRVP